MRCALVLALLLMPLPALAQQQADTAERAALAADARSEDFRKTADAADMKARQARFTAIALARQIQEGEARATRIEGRIAGLERVARKQRARLAERQGSVVKLLAALQSLSRRPQALVLFEPQSAIDTARVSALLAAVRPLLAERTRSLRRDLARTRALQTQLAEARRQLSAAETALRSNIAALEALQRRQRAERDSLDAKADAERKRAGELANRALDLRDLTRAVEGDAAARYASGPRLTVKPAGSFYRLPVAGTVRTAFGRLDESRSQSRGLTLQTRELAQVTAPAGGRVAYSGPFRTYGDIVIIEHDGSRLSLVSGMERVDVVVGETVRIGTPIGRMGSVRPELYLELRQNGTPIDPVRHTQKRR